MLNLLLPLMVFLPILAGFVPLYVKDTKKLNKIIVAMCVAELVACGFLAFNAHH